MVFLGLTTKTPGFSSSVNKSIPIFHEGNPTFTFMSVEFGMTPHGYVVDHGFVLIWMFPKNGGFSPQIIHFDRVFHYFHHPFWGIYPYFWKHPLILKFPHPAFHPTCRKLAGRLCMICSDIMLVLTE